MTDYVCKKCNYTATEHEGNNGQSTGVWRNGKLVCPKSEAQVLRDVLSGGFSLLDRFSQEVTKLKTLLDEQKEPPMWLLDEHLENIIRYRYGDDAPIILRSHKLLLRSKSSTDSGMV